MAFKHTHTYTIRLLNDGLFFFNKFNYNYNVNDFEDFIYNTEEKIQRSFFELSKVSGNVSWKESC